MKLGKVSKIARQVTTVQLVLNFQLNIPAQLVPTIPIKECLHLSIVFTVESTSSAQAKEILFKAPALLELTMIIRRLLLSATTAQQESSAMELLFIQRYAHQESNQRPAPKHAPSVSLDTTVPSGELLTRTCLTNLVQREPSARS